MITLILKYMPSVIIPTLCTLLATIMYGNYVDPESYGQYNLFVTTITLGNMLCFSFMNASAIRFCNTYKQDKLLSSYVTLISVILMILAPFAYFIVGMNGFLFVACLGIMSFYSIYTDVLRATENIRGFNVTKVFVPVLMVGILVAYIEIGTLHTSNLIIAAYAPMVVVVVIMTFIYMIKGKLRFAYDKDIVKQSLIYGVPMIGVGLLNIVLASSDRYVINYFLGSEQVGLYSFGYRLAELAMVNVAMIIMLALYPQAIKIYEEKGRVAAEKVVSKYLNVHLIVSIPIIFLFFLYTGDILRALFPKYEEAEQIVVFTSIGTFFYVTSFYTNKGFELSKQTKKMFYLLLSAGGINVLLNVLLVPLFGTIGSVLATIAAYVFYLIVSIVVSKKVFTLRSPHRNVFFILLGNVIATGVVKMVPIPLEEYKLIHLIVHVVLYLGTYGGVMYGLLRSRKIGLEVNGI